MRFWLRVETISRNRVERIRTSAGGCGGTKAEIELRGRDRFPAVLAARFHFDELKQRPDAAKALAAGFAAAEASDAPRAVRLHAAFGFPMEERAKACARLRGLNGNRQYKELEKACKGIAIGKFCGLKHQH